MRPNHTRAPTRTHTHPHTHTQVETGEEPGLEYDADSEEELDALGALCTDPGSGLAPPLRFKLLHNLWCAGVPRSRSITITRADSAGAAAAAAAGGATR
jgi:hypothetical protein